MLGPPAVWQSGTPRSFAAQAASAEADEDALLEEGGGAPRAPARYGRPPSGRRSSLDIRQPCRALAGDAAAPVRMGASMDGCFEASSFAAASRPASRQPVAMEGMEGGPSLSAPAAEEAPAAMTMGARLPPPEVYCPRRNSAGW